MIVYKLRCKNTRKWFSGVFDSLIMDEIKATIFVEKLRVQEIYMYIKYQIETKEYGVILKQLRDLEIVEFDLIERKK